MATATSGTLSYILDEVTSSVLINQFVQVAQVFPTLYTLRTSNKARERATSIGGLGQFDEKIETQAAAEETPTQQYQKTFNHTPFAKTVPVSRELIDDEDWGWFGNLGMQLGQAAARTMETQAAGVFNDAFAGATYVGEDGLSLCNSHTNVDGGNSQGNTGTTALSAAAVKSTRTSMKGFTDYEGETIGITPNALVVPDGIEQDAWEIVRSNLKPGTSNNDANFYQGMFQLFVWTYLSDANNWFMMDTMHAAMHLIWYMRSGLEVYGDGDLFVGKRRIGAYFRKSHGFIDWRWVYGHAVA